MREEFSNDYNPRGFDRRFEFEYDRETLAPANRPKREKSPPKENLFTKALLSPKKQSSSTKKLQRAPRYTTCYVCGSPNVVVSNLLSHMKVCEAKRRKHASIIRRSLAKSPRKYSSSAQLKIEVPVPPAAMPPSNDSSAADLRRYNEEARRIYQTSLPRCPHEGCTLKLDYLRLKEHTLRCAYRPRETPTHYHEIDFV